MERLIAIFTLFLLSLTGTLVWAAPATDEKTNEQVLQEIQRDLIELDQQFETVRQDIFFPKDAEVLFYLRNNIKDVFPVKSIELQINNKKVYSHDYTDSEKVAFNFSGLQPLSRLELKPGNYQITARLTLLQAKAAPVKEFRFSVDKQDAPRFVEMEISMDRKTKDLALAPKIW